MINKFLPYGKQSLDDNDINEVVKVLRSDWLTTGPKIDEFEEVVANYVGAKYAVAVSSGTAALHSAIYAIGITKGDEVILPTMTFAATANCVVYQGGTPVFVDIFSNSLLIDTAAIEEKITSKTKAIIAVDYAGHPADYDVLNDLALKHNLYLIADAAHSIGGTFKNKSIGSLADLTTFSFHPVKNITTGEGGMITTDSKEFSIRMKNFRNHGITSDHRQRAAEGSWFYEMVDLGYNYRITDFQAALGISQIKKLPKWIARRKEIAQSYTIEFNNIKSIDLLSVKPNANHAWHLFAVLLNLDELKTNRADIFLALRGKNIGVNVHYVPVHLHPYYKKNYGYKNGDFPNAENAYKRLVSLPMYPTMDDSDIQYVISALKSVIK